MLMKSIVKYDCTHIPPNQTYEVLCIVWCIETVLPRGTFIETVDIALLQRACPIRRVVLANSQINAIGRTSCYSQQESNLWDP